jgi:hypothetical protein
MQGFAPADEVLLFRQNDPKPFPPVRGPTGTSATPNAGCGRQLLSFYLRLNFQQKIATKAQLLIP